MAALGSLKGGYPHRTLMRPQVLILCLLLIVPAFAGCIGDAEPESESEPINDNQIPDVYWSLRTTQSETWNETFTTFRWLISVIDYDGIVVSVGVDSDLDGNIDIPFFLNSSNWSTPGVYYGPMDLTYADADTIAYGWEYCYWRFALMVVDNDGGVAKIPIQTTAASGSHCSS